MIFPILCALFAVYVLVRLSYISDDLEAMGEDLDQMREDD